MPWLRRYWPYVTLALTPLLVLWRAVFMGQVIGPFDQIRQMQPWGAPAPAQPWDVLQADGVLQFYPWRQLVFESWGRFQVPFWNHYELAGTPLLANSQSAAFYPPHILMGILHVPTAFAMTLLAWFHLAWAGLGVFFLARQLGANRLGGTFAGMCFTLSAFMVSWTGLPSVITTVAWIPWVLFGTLRLFEKAERSRWLVLAVATAMLILAGHLQFVAYGMIASLIIALWQLACARDFKSGGAWVLALVFGAVLASPQLGPVLDYSKYSHRRNVPTEEGYAGYATSAIQPFELIGIMHPNLMGSPTEPVAGIETPQPLSSYWPEYVKRGANFAEGAVGVAPLAFGLLLVLVLRRRFDLKRLGGVVLLGSVALLLATGTGLNRLLYFGVPGWSSTGSPGRISVLFLLAMCVLAGVALTREEPASEEPKWQRFAPAGFVAFLGLASIYAAMFGLTGLQPLQPLNAEILNTIIASALGSAKAFAGLSTLVAAGALAAWAVKKSVPGWALLVAVAAGFFLSVPQVLHFSKSADLTSKAYGQVGLKPYERVANLNKQWELWMAAPANHPPNTSSLSRLHELGGYDSLLHRDTVAMLKEVDGQDPAPMANGNMMFVKTAERLAGAGVTAASWVADGKLQVQRIEGPGRAFTEAGPAEITYEDGGQMRLTASGPGKLQLKDRNMPGWTALVDGKEAPLGGTIWREVELPEGRHEVVMNYVAPGYSPWIGLMAWLAAGLVAMFGLRPRQAGQS